MRPNTQGTTDPRTLSELILDEILRRENSIDDLERFTGKSKAANYRLLALARKARDTKDTSGLKRLHFEKDLLKTKKGVDASSSDQ